MTSKKPDPSQAPHLQVVDDAEVPHAQTSAAGAMGTVITLCFAGLIASLMQTLIIPVQPELPALLGTSISSASWIILSLIHI